MSVVKFELNKKQEAKRQAKKLIEEIKEITKKIQPDLDRIDDLTKRANDLLMGAV